ncbi:MAG: thiopurine S-methyltransferase [Gammaproteobacteria bacterium]|nr:MAG: thiopurine S-methyltransferase [Gammaproteobacteria bacterium]
MDAQFWHDRWEYRDLGFHQKRVNPFLARHFSRLGLTSGNRMFVPLCGKTLDSVWLLSEGIEIAGVELNETAVREFFTELDVQPDISQSGRLTLYRADGIHIYVGDLFDLTAQQLGPVDAIYDRAALVALPDTMRQRYTRHLVDIGHHAPQLLISFEYDQSAMAGPPFCVAGEEIHRHYDAGYVIQRLDAAEVRGGLKGVCPGLEVTWLLERR